MNVKAKKWNTAEYEETFHKRLLELRELMPTAGHDSPSLGTYNIYDYPDRPWYISGLSDREVVVIAAVLKEFNGKRS